MRVLPLQISAFTGMVSFIPMTKAVWESVADTVGSLLDLVSYFSQKQPGV